MSALHSLGWSLSETDAVRIIREMDWNQTGHVEYCDFATWIIDQEKDNATDVDPDALCKRAFDHIDKDGGGSITAQELLDALRDLGEDEMEYDLPPLSTITLQQVHEPGSWHAYDGVTTVDQRLLTVSVGFAFP